MHNFIFTLQHWHVGKTFHIIHEDNVQLLRKDVDANCYKLICLILKSMMIDTLLSTAPISYCCLFPQLQQSSFHTINMCGSCVVFKHNLHNPTVGRKLGSKLLKILFADKHTPSFILLYIWSFVFFIGKAEKEYPPPPFNISITQTPFRLKVNALGHKVGTYGCEK